MSEWIQIDLTSLIVFRPPIGERPMDCDTLNDLTMSHTQFNMFAAPITAETDPFEVEAELDLLKNTFGDDDPAVADCLTKLADLFCRRGELTRVEPLLLEALSIRRQNQGAEHAAVATDLKNLGRLYYFQGRYSAAEPIFKRALLIREKLFGKGHPKVMDMAK